MEKPYNPEEVAELVADAEMAGEVEKPRFWTHSNYVFIPGRYVVDGNGAFQCIAKDFRAAELITKAVNRMLFGGLEAASEDNALSSHKYRRRSDS